jgi:hypothetical protein
LELDGIFLTSADKEVNSDNVRRLEQRLVNSGQAQYFREDNGQLIMDNKLFEAKHFRRTDISLMKNNFHSFIKRNAVICERLNQKKKTYYQMEVFVGKLYIENTSLFEEEDRLAAKLKRQMRLYREKVDKSLIPHYGQVLEEQSLAFDRLQEDPNHKVGDLALISKQMVDTQAKLNTEKSELDQIMRETYANWKSIKDVRARQGYVSTPVELVVQQYVS